MVENGRKWWKMGCRGYLVGNGFPRVSRQSPTTSGIHMVKKNRIVNDQCSIILLRNRI